MNCKVRSAIIPNGNDADKQVFPEMKIECCKEAEK